MRAPSRGQIERILSRALGIDVRVERLTPLAPWSVARCRVRVGAGGTLDLVVKWLRAHPEGLRSDPAQVATERAALEFLAAIGFAHAPRLVAADHAAGVLVMEDLAPREPPGWLQRAAAWLRRRWPDADVDLGAIPAFRPRG